jgi:hypothetical protein
VSRCRFNDVDALYPRDTQSGGPGAAGTHGPGVDAAAALPRISIDMYNNDVGKNFMK